MIVPDPITISSTIFLNIASDIVAHQAKHLEKTFAGRLLKWGGLIEPDFSDRLRESIKQALQLLFQKHPEYNLTGIEGFFRDPEVAQEIGAYILDHQPIDQQKVQQSLDKHLMQDAVTVLLIQKRKVVPAHIIPDFLACYRQVLNTQLSVSEMSLLLEIMDQSDRVLDELKANETRMRAYIDELKQSKLSPQALQAASQANQQQGMTDLIENLNTAKLARPDEASLTIQKRLQSLPALFTDGLCRGLQMQPAPYEYFVSHGFQPETLVDWRKNLTEALAQIDNTQKPLTPYFHGDTLMSGYRLCSICEKLYTTRFSIFLLPPNQDRNVYLELGIALAMGAPFLLIQSREVEPPPVLTSLNRYINDGVFRTIRQQLPGQIGNIEEYNFAVVRLLRELPAAGSQPKYVIAAGNRYDDPDVEGTLGDILQARYPYLEAVSLAQQAETTGSSWMIEQLMDTIQTARFMIYRVSEGCSPTTFLSLGISIALNRPFLLINKSDSTVPLDLRGIGLYQFANFSALEKEFVARHQSPLDRYAQPPK